MGGGSEDKEEEEEEEREESSRGRVANSVRLGSVSRLGTREAKLGARWAE